MKELKQIIENLKKSKVKNVINDRIKEFKLFGKKSSNEIFKELCYCLLTANFNAERTIKIQNELDDDFLKLNQKELSSELRRLGHRFPNMRAKFIVLARKYKEEICKLIKIKNEYKMREWLVDNIKGLGYKEASHFLRNIGYENLAIIDFHIVDVLVENGFIEKPKTLTKKKYIKIEKLLQNLGKELNLNMAELDLYLWYIETGKVLK